MSEITIEDKKYFLKNIKKECIIQSMNYNVLPSVICSIAIYISKWGTSKLYGKTNNYFENKVDDNWTGWCYSKESDKIYNNYSESVEKNVILYKSYVDHTESIKDFLNYLKESRRSNNGPLRYTDIFGATDFNNVVDILIQFGFVKDYIHYENENEWYNEIIGIILSNNLYEWDNKMEELVMSKKNKPKINLKSHDIENKVDHMYRVRLDWNKPDTQIFASPNYNDAREEALKHEGYKIYIDDDGEMFENPWDKPKEKEIEKNIPGVVNLIYPLPGHPITLNNTLVYRNAIDKSSFKSLSGIFYFYDSTIVNGRAKITKYKDIPLTPDPNRILGYIKIR